MDALVRNGRAPGVRFVDIDPKFGKETLEADGVPAGEPAHVGAARVAKGVHDSDRYVEGLPRFETYPVFAGPNLEGPLEHVEHLGCVRVVVQRRTRRALLEAARQTIAEGGTPSVAEVAERALVSRATAYRYFPTQDALLSEAPLDVDAPTEQQLFGHDAPASAAERVERVRKAMYEFAVGNEREYRLFLRNWHDRWLRRTPADPAEPRGARRVELLERALEPLRRQVGRARLRRAKVALSVLIGVESMLVHRDVLGIDRAEAEAAMEWAVRVLVDALGSPGVVPSLKLALLPDRLAVCRLEPGDPVPAWADAGTFCSITRTERELSVTCPETVVPEGITAETGWACLRVEGTFPFETVGVASSLTAPLAAAGISLLLISTHDTDYLLMKADRLPAARAALGEAGFSVA